MGLPNHSQCTFFLKGLSVGLGACWETLETLPSCVLMLPPGGHRRVLHRVAICLQIEVEF